MGAGRLYIGTSGWTYPHWAGGRFYPKGLRQGEWLAYLATRFNTVEINSTYYRLPRESMVERWRTVTPGHFRFAVKCWRMITHRKKLRDCEDLLAEFLRVAGGLGRKRGPLLIQLPPSLHKDLPVVEEFLVLLRRTAGRTRWRPAVEFRHPSWDDEETREALGRYGAALCLADWGRCPFTEPNEADFVYIRRHGPSGRYRGCYSRQHIRADARRIAEWIEAGRDVFVYYNNDVEGYAVDNALSLIDACRAELGVRA